MKIKYLILTFSIFYWPLFSQKDSPFKSSKLKLEWENPVSVEPKNSAPGIQYKSILEDDNSYLRRYAINKN